AWRWKGEVLDRHAATDADTDIALALLIASRRFEAPDYEREALEVIQDIWRLEMLPVRGAVYPTAGDWAKESPNPEIHIGYLAPYAYQEFAKVDPEHDWKGAVTTSYAILHSLYFEAGVKMPPEKVWLDRQTGRLALSDPQTGETSQFGYDAFPIFWRLALDANWHWRVAGFETDLVSVLRALGIRLSDGLQKRVEQAELHE